MLKNQKLLLAIVCISLGDIQAMNSYLIMARDSVGNAKEISLESWKRFVQTSKYLKLRNKDYVTRNPKTSEVIRVPWKQGDAELILPDHTIFSIHYSSGILYFTSRLPSNHEHFIKKQMVAIARHFNAAIYYEDSDGPESW
jgi:hypothetical protein